MTDHLPARVQALAEQIKDTPLAWNERADGSIVIVFSNKGKLTFDPTEGASAPSAPLPPGEGKGEGEPPTPPKPKRSKSK